MGSPDNLRADARVNLVRVLDAATIVVRRDGAQVPMATIAAAAGVGVGTLYRRFPTRSALLNALTRRSYERLLDNIRAIGDSERSGLAAIAALLEFVVRNRDQLVLPMHGGPTDLDDATRAAGRKLRRAVQELVDRARNDGSVGAHVQSIDIIVFAAMLTHPVPMTNQLGSWDAIAGRLQRTYLDGLRPRRTGTS